MTYPQNPAPQQPEKKNWAARHKILTALGVVIAVAVVVNLASGGSDSSSVSSVASLSSSAVDASAPASEPETESSPGIGVPVRDGKFEFVVQSVQPGVTSVGENYVEQTPQGEYVLVTLSAANIGDRQQLFDITSQKLLDAAGRQFSADTVATITNDPNISVTQINPGNSVVATLVFDVPAGTSPAEIELHDSLFSGGTVVALT
ncbi:Mpr protein [Rhodococcoides trifolii]|uniref:Mpr protein n=1 Tax=Rhodococcoides trifolii TaxID=908250 RepID=A0A917CVM2_9NOCA|nr:DUF4352 domain-containing protein [Rhodococcus trifolii]GGF99168.1 Mpr protein [Rhodococcus trifolii]